jgi:hypothetical protein
MPPIERKRCRRIIAEIGQLQTEKGNLVRHGTSGFVKGES